MENRHDVTPRARELGDSVHALAGRVSLATRYKSTTELALSQARDNAARLAVDASALMIELDHMLAAVDRGEPDIL